MVVTQVENNMISIKKDKKYLVTGGSGFLGAKVIEKILSQGGKVVTISRDEGKLIELKQKFPEVEFYQGSYAQTAQRAFP